MYWCCIVVLRDACNLIVVNPCGWLCVVLLFSWIENAAVLRILSLKLVQFFYYEHCYVVLIWRVVTVGIALYVAAWYCGAVIWWWQSYVVLVIW